VRAKAPEGFGPRARARGVLVLLGVLTVLGVMLVQSGSAATTSKPYTANFCTTPDATTHQCPLKQNVPSSAVPVTAGEPLYLTLVNNTGTQNLGSFNLDAYPGFTFTNATISSSSNSTIVDADLAPSSTLLAARNLNIAPTGYVTVRIGLTASCSVASSTQDWSSPSLIETKQANNFSGAPGNDLTLTQPSDLTTSTTGVRCLRWQVQPTSAVTSTTTIKTLITGAPYDPSAGTTGAGSCYSSPSPGTGSSACVVEVDAVDGTGLDAKVINLNGGTVTLTPSSLTEGFAGLTSSEFKNGTAVFTNLTAGGTTGNGFTFTAHADDPAQGFGNAPESSPFNVTDSGEPCNFTNGCPNFTTSLLDGAQVDASSGPGFAFIAIDKDSLPNPLPQGCQHYVSLGNGALTETDGRIDPVTHLPDGAGTLKFTYAIPNSLIKKSPNNGQPFVPICAGAAWVDSNGTVHRCDDKDAPTAWMGDELTNGALDGKPKQSMCDATTGLDWGILGNYQDSWITPGVDPMITNWKSDSKFRYFFISVPPPWDYSMGGG
jgi:hypothetical protein